VNRRANNRAKAGNRRKTKINKAGDSKESRSKADQVSQATNRDNKLSQVSAGLADNHRKVRSPKGRVSNRN
jgi:hypothetical protein